MRDGGKGEVQQLMIKLNEIDGLRHTEYNSDPLLLEMFDTLEAALKVVEAAKEEHKRRTEDSFMKIHSCGLCHALRPFTGEDHTK